jgi:hypothetical protein
MEMLGLDQFLSAIYNDYPKQETKKKLEKKRGNPSRLIC